MKKYTAANVYYKLAQFFNSIGFVMWVLQFFWLVILYIENVKQTPLGGVILDPDIPEQPVQVGKPYVATAIEPNGFVVFLVILAIVGLVFLAIRTIRRDYIPAVKHTAEKVVTSTAEVIVEKTTQPKASKKKKQLLVKSLIFWIKLLISVLSLGVIVVFSHDNPYVSELASWMVALLLSTLAISAFLVSEVFGVVAKRQKSKSG